MVMERDYLDRARKVLQEAANLQSQVSRHELARATALFERAKRAIQSNIGELTAEAAARVAEYDGLPVRVNAFDVLGVRDIESAHSSTLRWLLDPSESHGLGDMMLRRLLARRGDHVAAALANSESPLEAVAVNELGLDKGYVDIVVVARKVVVAIEVKVWASEHRLSWGNTTAGQTSIYRQQLVDHEVRRRALWKMGARAVELAGARPTVMMFFVRPRGAEPALDGAKTASLDWLQIERDLGLLMRRCEPAAEARSLLQAFRTTLLETSGALSPTMPMIVALRRLVDMPALRRADPLRTLLQLRALGEVNTSAPRPEARVYTSYKHQTGFQYAEVKRSAKNKLEEPADDLDLSASRMTMVDRSVAVDLEELGELPARIAEEVYRQLPIAAALRHAIVELLAREAGGVEAGLPG